MKKIALGVYIFLTITYSANAQVKFGFKAGANFSNIVGDHSKIFTNGEYNTVAYSRKAGYYVGGVVNLHIKGVFSIEAEAVYSLQGAKADSSYSYYDATNDQYIEGSSSGKENLTYLQVPVMTKFTFKKRFLIETGPQIDFLLAAKSKLDKVVDIKNKRKSVDAGWTFGLGYMSSIGLGITTRYYIGVTSIGKNLGTSENSDNVFKDHNSNIQVGLVYMFNWNDDKKD